MMHEAPATPRRKSASSDELDYADANKYDDLEEAQALLDAENGEKIKKKAPPRNLFGFYLHGTAPPGRFDEFAFREASAPPRSPRPEAVPESVGAMRSLIASAGLSSADCVEKPELRARSALALERLAEAK